MSSKYRLQINGGAEEECERTETGKYLGWPTGDGEA